ncbi:hypothetical protein V8G54_022981 [Vigna mungo]|uniref:NB-ARC domain-containing protein n=1 Tax=Vigna mungo TaxID=3915 RepID=A0AAQ3N2C0_VIGMU
MLDTEDLLEEIDHALTKSQVEAQSQSSTKKVWNSFKSSFISFFKNEIESRMENLIENLEDLATQNHDLDLKKADDVGVRSLFSRKLPSIYLPNESVIYGRDDNKQYVFNWLKSDIPNNPSILSIVGMGGVGKTTLAQHIYNDPRVDEAELDVKAWVCVSIEFDVLKVSRKILEDVTRSLDQSTNTDMEEVRKPLLFRAQGNRFVVTTRSKEVACTMLHAFRDDDDTQSNPKCREIGMKIVKMCKGLPLALKTMGSLLYNKSSVSEWKIVSQSVIWEFSKEQCDIILALALSYIHFPSHLKKKFANNTSMIHYRGPSFKEWVMRKNYLLCMTF